MVGYWGPWGEGARGNDGLLGSRGGGDRDELVG